MPNLVQIVPVDLAFDPSWPVADPSDFELVGNPDYEISAAAHWQFYRGATGESVLTDPVSGKALSINAKAPEYGARSIKVFNGVSDGLVTDIYDSADARRTIWGCFRLPSGSGTWTPFSIINGSAAGSAFFVSNAAYAIAYGFAPNLPEIAPNPARDSWIFAAISLNAPEKKIYAQVGSIAYNSAGVTGNYIPGVVPIGLGRNGYASGVSSLGMDVAEFGIVPYAMSADEIAALYARRVSVLAQYGISVS